MNAEERILAWLAKHDEEEAKRAAEWIKAYGEITCAYAEFTGGHISRVRMDRILSENCFGK